MTVCSRKTVVVARSVILAVVVLALAGTATGASAERLPPRVPCDDVIGYAKSATAGGYRRVLGVVSVPGAHLPDVEDTGHGPWRYWRKAGLVVRAGPAIVTVSVPPAWRKRAAISWGNNTGIVSSLRIGGCTRPPGGWLAFAGGFVLRTPSACLPLTFKVGSRTATVRFGLGTRCRGA